MSCCFTSLLIIIWKCLVVFVMSLLLLTIEINSDLEQLSVFFLDIRLGRKDIKSWILLLKNFCSKNVIFHEDIFPYTTDSNNSFFFFHRLHQYTIQMFPLLMTLITYHHVQVLFYLKLCLLILFLLLSQSSQNLFSFLTTASPSLSTIMHRS